MHDLAVKVCLLLFLLSLFCLRVIAASQIEPRKAPGVSWKLSYNDFPELDNIQRSFALFCSVIPSLRASYMKDLMTQPDYLKIRQDCLSLPNEEFYTDFELGNHLKARTNIKHMYNTQSNNKGYRERLGCLTRDVSDELEEYARQQINGLMARLGLVNSLQRLSDSRGHTYMSPWGCMEYHTNRNHLIGWRIYFHYLPRDKGSFFAYKHPYDGSYRRIYDSNQACNLFRLRDGKNNSPLLWHSIYSNVDRFSWGIYIPPELAQYLKPKGICI